MRGEGPRVLGIATRRHEHKPRPNTEQLREAHAAKMRERNATNIRRRAAAFKVWQTRKAATA